MCSYPWRGGQRPSGVCSGDSQVLDAFKAWGFPSRFSCETLEGVFVLSRLCSVPPSISLLQKWKGFPWLDKGRRGLCSKGPVVGKHPSSQAGLNCHSTAFPGVTGTFLTAHTDFVASKNALWPFASVKSSALGSELWWSIALGFFFF